MQSFKLKNSRKRWWRCLGAVRSVISSRGKQVQAWKKVPEGPWTPRRAETREAQQRDAFPVSPGLRARAPALCQTALHPAAPGDERAPTLALLPHRAPLSPCKGVCGSVLSFPSHCARPPPRQSRLIPLTRNTPNSATADRASPPRDAHPSTPPWNVLLPWSSAPSFLPPAESKVTSFTTPYPKSALLNYFHSILKHHFEVDTCVCYF